MLVALLGATHAFGGLYQDLFRALDIYATPTGGPLSRGADGMRFNGQRTGRLRIIPESIGDGFTLELDRNFGTDSRGRPEIMDFGPLEIELSGTTGATLGYTNRGIPAANANIGANNLQYSLRFKTGAQDVDVSGTLNSFLAMEVNRFGFYSMQLTANNAGDSQVMLDGVLVNDQLDTNFNVGPITVEGNVFFDAFLGVLTAFGADTTGLEGITPQSPIDRINDEIERVLRGQLNGQVAGLTLDGESLALPAGIEPARQAPSIPVPEPGTLILIGVGGLGYYFTQRRRR